MKVRRSCFQMLPDGERCCHRKCCSTLPERLRVVLCIVCMNVPVEQKTTSHDKSIRAVDPSHAQHRPNRPRQLRLHLPSETNKPPKHIQTNPKVRRPPRSPSHMANQGPLFPSTHWPSPKQALSRPQPPDHRAHHHLSARRSVAHRPLPSPSAFETKHTSAHVPRCQNRSLMSRRRACSKVPNKRGATHAARKGVRRRS